VRIANIIRWKKQNSSTSYTSSNKGNVMNKLEEIEIVKHKYLDDVILLMILPMTYFTILSTIYTRHRRTRNLYLYTHFHVFSSFIYTWWWLLYASETGCIIIKLITTCLYKKFYIPQTIFTFAYLDSSCKSSLLEMSMEYGPLCIALFW